jgi:hypothetical protein
LIYNQYQLGEWLAELLPRLSEIILMDTVESSGPCGCVLHGDYWINNMLFKYSDESQTQDGEKSPSIPVSLRMIDFQQSRIGHPLNDILYFFYTSTRFETRQKHMLVLLRYYFDTLAADLRLLGISLDDCTWQDFLAEYKKRSLMWMFLCIMLLANALNKKALGNLLPEEILQAPTPGNALFPSTIFLFLTHENTKYITNMFGNPLFISFRDGHGDNQGTGRNEC